MPEQKAFLEKIHIKNFLSLRNVTLPLKPLTVLVGPNASGKTNILDAFNFLNEITALDSVPLVEAIQDLLWAGKANRIVFQLQAKVEDTPVLYEVDIEANADTPFVAEQLLVNSLEVISIQNGEGKVWDEDEKNETTYSSDKLALKSAGDYGNKPITSTLTDFVMGWELYDFQPSRIRRGLARFMPVMKDRHEVPKLDDEGLTLAALLSYWYENDQERFNGVNGSLASSTNLKMDFCAIEGVNQLCLLEAYKKPIPLAGASDGTLRLVSYYSLLYHSKLPPLIAIEEPERSLHPGALKDIAYVLERISERTQVIITTHSSQLLDAFNPENLSDSLGVLLLRNRSGLGTEVLNLEEIRGKREALDGWIADFGIGSAIFDSELLQDLMEEPV